MIKPKLLIVILLLTLIFPIKGAAEGELRPASAGQEEQITLSLEKCIELGFKNNFGIKKSNYDILSSKEATEQIKSQYEPMITASVGKTDIETSGTNPLYGTKTKKDSISIGLNKKFHYTGGSLGLDWSNEKTDSDSIFQSFNPTYDSDITLSYTQPLIKNFAGNNDKKSIHISKIGSDTADLALTLQKNILANNIEKALLSLNFAEENLRIQKIFLERSKKLLAINKEKLKDGLVEEVDIIATEAAVTVREASILLAENSVKDAKDNLKKIIGLPGDKNCFFVMELPEKFEHHELHEDETIQKALKQRPDLKIIENSIEMSLFDTEVKRNERLPSLDLATRYGSSNSDKSWGDNYSAIASIDNPTWYIGLNLSIFPFRKLNSSILKQSEYEYKKNLDEREDKKLSIITECKGITRSINTQALYVKATFKALELQKKKLQLEELKFNQGRSSIQWILTYHDDLNRAEIDSLKALTEYYKAIVDLKLITGVIR
ncbi:MAG: TolC family protein [Elusimicrobia bacterium]|nr:TolC family protein [Elusimicrobiota bacterium]